MENKGEIMYSEEFEFSLDLVKKCGEVIKAAFNAEKKISEKSAPNDLVTETDQLVEKMLIEGLRERFPDTSFIGEESVAGGEKCELTERSTWIIDPIDGTTNFISSNPQICTILGFMVDKEVQFGIVYNPILDQLWTARKGQGAEYNGSKIHVSSCTNLSTALLIQEMGGSSSDQKIEMVNKNLQTFIPKVRSIRAYGSAGINLAYLAMGAVDAYFEFGFHIWDYAAPLLIVREAGGVAMDTSGGQVDYLARRMLATASKELADQILPNITSIHMERD
eukprot:GFUD01011267.1.p1 GENE.GFUD01011267.1~~GFUD01011267.1.p1  ORF type:complete len:278 (+),score=82.81 GFUD01011267.1:111-944(+)